MDRSDRRSRFSAISIELNKLNAVRSKRKESINLLNWKEKNSSHVFVSFFSKFETTSHSVREKSWMWESIGWRGSRFQTTSNVSPTFYLFLYFTVSVWPPLLGSVLRQRNLFGVRKSPRRYWTWEHSRSVGWSKIIPRSVRSFRTTGALISPRNFFTSSPFLLLYDSIKVKSYHFTNFFFYFYFQVNHFKDFIPEAFPGGNDLILDTEILMIDTNTGKPLPFGSLGVHKARFPFFFPLFTDKKITKDFYGTTYLLISFFFLQKAEFKDANVCLFVFDCLYYNGESLLDM